jgi:hypothetical protein
VCKEKTGRIKVAGPLCIFSINTQQPIIIRNNIHHPLRDSLVLCYWKTIHLGRRGGVGRYYSWVAAFTRERYSRAISPPLLLFYSVKREKENHEAAKFCLEYLKIIMDFLDTLLFKKEYIYTHLAFSKNHSQILTENIKNEFLSVNMITGSLPSERLTERYVQSPGVGELCIAVGQG